MRIRRDPNVKGKNWADDGRHEVFDDIIISNLSLN